MDSVLVGVDFSGTDLSNTVFVRTNLSGAIFLGAKLDGAVFLDCELVEVQGLLGQEFIEVS
jgi:uncharacterized protein YjbI with pentapeptide repeats